MHGESNGITVKYNGTWQSIDIFLEVHKKFVIQIPINLFITKQLQKYFHGNRNILCDVNQEQQI